MLFQKLCFKSCSPQTVDLQVFSNHLWSKNHYVFYFQNLHWKTYQSRLCNDSSCFQLTIPFYCEKNSTFHSIGNLMFELCLDQKNVNPQHEERELPEIFFHPPAQRVQPKIANNLQGLSCDLTVFILLSGRVFAFLFMLL